MNSAIRLLVLSAAACAVATAVAPAASGRQTRRHVGNPAEVERLERERMEREMRERDLRERQWLLRTLKAEPAGEPPEGRELRLAVTQIREDFVRLQVVNNDLARAASKGGALDLRFVAKSASDIRKFAGRLKENLALPEPEEDSGRAAKAAPEPAQLSQALSALDGLILKFADGLASGGVYHVDARSSAGARRDLQEIIALSGWVKKTSEKMEKAARK